MCPEFEKPANVWPVKWARQVANGGGKFNNGAMNPILCVYFQRVGFTSDKYWIQKTKIEKFESEETLEIEISREEQLMNIIERMEKFRCDDFDDE